MQKRSVPPLSSPQIKTYHKTDDKKAPKMLRTGPTAVNVLVCSLLQVLPKNLMHALHMIIP